MKRWLLAASLCTAVLGCGTASAPPQAQAIPVKGKVMLDGKPLAGALVMFSAAQSPAVFSGWTKDDGSYELQGLSGRPALEGTCKVTISRMVKPDGSPLAPNEAPANVGAVEQLPPKYSQVDATELSRTIAARGGTFDFDLTSK